VTPDPSLIAAIQVRLLGDAPGEWWLKADRGEASTGPGLMPSADITVEAGSEDFLDLVEGRLEPLAAILGGKVKLSGNLALAQKLPSLFSRKT
jgi:putative sterol carrier protein